jgi:hypothetical protein
MGTTGEFRENEAKLLKEISGSIGGVLRDLLSMLHGASEDKVLPMENKPITASLSHIQVSRQELASFFTESVGSKADRVVLDWLVEHYEQL